MNLRLSLRAEADLVEIALYLVERSPQAARRVEDALQDAFGLIATYPHIGPEIHAGLRRLTLPRYPYLIFYGVDETADEVQIFTVRHAARDEESRS